MAAKLSRSGTQCDLFDVQPSAKGQTGEYHRCDVLDGKFWEGFDPGKYEAIFFFAGLSGVEPSFNNPRKFVEVNELGLVNLLEKLAPLGEKSPKVIFPSSRLVYRGGGVVDEESPLESRSVYSANKIACEAFLAAYHVRWKIPYAAMRICIPYGNLLPNENPLGLVSIFKHQAGSKGEITVYGDGSNTRTFTHVSDICRAAELLAEKGESGVYNVGGHTYTLQQVAEFVSRRIPAKVVNVPWPEAAELVEMRNISLDAGKLARETGMKEYKDLRDYIAEL